MSRLSVEEELGRLSDLSLDELKARWLELKGVSLPKFMRRRLMTRAVAYAIQEAAYGGLDPSTRKRLDELAAQIVPTGTATRLRPNRVKPGTRLVREWKGRVHDVMVLEDGFAWKGKRYTSLSMIAREITGTRWNGWVFFGLKQRERELTAAAAALPKRRREMRHHGSAQGRDEGNQTRAEASARITAPPGEQSDG
jgi:hypothetical protein